MFENDYPDVLGTITGGVRHDMATVQCAIGVYPAGSAVGQPFEILVALQSTIDQPQEIVLAILLPRKDSAGHRLSFFVPRKQVKLTLGPGEVGVMQLPVMAQPPTLPAQGYPVQIRVLAQAQGKPKPVRSPGAGRPPSALSVSPFRLEVLREVKFCGDAQGNQLRCRFNVIPGNVKVGLANPQPKYEALWTAQDFNLEKTKIEASIELAERMSYDFVRGNIFHMIEEATRERFAHAGLPLHPGEALFIAKAITYVFEDAYRFEQGFELYDARWFQWLCSMIVRDETVTEQDPGRLAANELYFGGVYDAIRVCLPMVQAATEEEFGTPEEHRAYADKAVQAMQGNGPMDLNYAYLPLVMAGMLLHMRMEMRYENLWESVDLLEEARRGRARLAVGKENPVFGTLDKVLEATKDLLRRSRVAREE